MCSSRFSLQSRWCYKGAGPAQATSAAGTFTGVFFCRRKKFLQALLDHQADTRTLRGAPLVSMDHAAWCSLPAGASTSLARRGPAASGLHDYHDEGIRGGTAGDEKHGEGFGLSGWRHNALSNRLCQGPHLKHPRLPAEHEREREREREKSKRLTVIIQSYITTLGV